MSAGSRAGQAVLAVLLAVVSWHSAWALGGLLGAVGDVVVTVVVLAIVGPWMSARLPPRVLPALVVIVAAVLTLAFVIGIPPAYGDALGVGSDRANALGVALSRLADGSYPYSATTYLGNPITPLPGALLLAAPFWAVTGDAAWQNPVWLVLLLAVLHGRRPLRARPTVLWVLVTVGGLEVLREFLVGDDLVTGAVPAAAALAVTLRTAGTPSTSARSTVAVAAAALVLGVTTCTRPHLLLVLVVAVAAVGVRAGWRRAAVVGVVAAATWSALIVPFLLGGVARFSPLHVAAKVTGDRSVTVGIVGLALVAVGVLVGVLAVLRPSTPARVGWCCAAVLFAPTVLSLAKGLTVGPATDIDLTLGAVAIPFAAWAVAGRPDQAPTTMEQAAPEAIGLP